MSEHGAELIIRFQTLRPMSWRNGGGTTREIAACGTEGGESFNWRLSLATIEGPGRFSEFPGMTRIFTVVEGESVALTVDGHMHLVAYGTPFRFSGDAAVRAALPQGSVHALNVITRSSATIASVEIERLTPGRALRLLPGQWAVLLSGWATLVAGDVIVAVGVYDTVRGGREMIAELVGEGFVAAVSLQPGSSA